MNIHSSKDESIRWMNALNGSSAIVAAMLKNKPDGDAKSAIVDLANFLYNIEPALTDLQSKIKACNNIDELNLLKEEVAKTDSVSMFNSWNEKRVSLGA